MFRFARIELNNGTPEPPLPTLHTEEGSPNVREGVKVHIGKETVKNVRDQPEPVLLDIEPIPSIKTSKNRKVKVFIKEDKGIEVF